MKLVIRLGIAGFLLFAGVAVFLILRHQLFEQRYAGFQKPVFVEIARGTSTRKIGEQLAEAGVLRQAWHFPAMRILRFSRSPQAGDYQFKSAATPAEVFHRIASGDVFTYELRVPEGSNMWDIAALIEEVGILPSVEFLMAARKPSLISDLAPNANSLEGYLFPATYRFRRKTSAEEICRTMTGQFRKVWKESGSREPVHNLVTLASLVEKEAKLSEERPTIASVYANRMQTGMKLDCDPTVIYAALLEDRYRGTIYQSDLNSNNPYNTYKVPGLPPGPIANPGAASIRAALSPAQTDYLYFVAKPDGSGGHVFSKNLKTHNQAVKEYRRGGQVGSTAQTTAGAPKAAKRGGS